MKRIFDFLLALCSLVLVSFFLFLAWVLAAVSTHSNGLFIQKRVGRHGHMFFIYKLRTIHIRSGEINKIGVFLRKYKFDELPQLLNVIKGDMSFVGPRPDIPGYADKLTGEARKILELRPGITSIASLKYFNEEQILKNVEFPLEYNNNIIYPDKVKLNLEYYYHNSLIGDIKIILKTIFHT